MWDAETQVYIAKLKEIELAEDLFKDGYENLTNIDISATVIKQMQERYKEDLPLIKCKSYYFYLLVQIMDVRKLEFAPKSFNVVLDKGTLDCVLVKLVA